MQKLTDRQAEILEFIQWHWKETGEGPTPPEIAEHFNVWRGAINDVIKVLRKKGVLEPSKGKGNRCPIMPVNYRDKIKRALR